MFIMEWNELLSTTETFSPAETLMSTEVKCKLTEKEKVQKKTS